MKPLVSIIVPVYKVESFIRKCIESIMSQTYENIEIILVDDGSPDACGSICDSYAQKDHRVKVLHKTNGGLSDARNKGLEIAKGEYISFVDSDDYVEPKMIEMLLDAAIRNQCLLAMCAFFCENEDESLDDHSLIDIIPDDVLDAEDILPRLSKGNGWFYTVAWNKLYHRSLLPKSFYPVGKYHEDEFVIAPLLWNAKRVACISTRLYHYIYMRSGSITGSQLTIRHLDSLEALYQRCCFYTSIDKEYLMTEDRAYYFYLLEKFTIEMKNKSPEVKKKLKTAVKLFGQIPGLKQTERVRYFLFCISPRLEYWIVQKIRNIR